MKWTGVVGGGVIVLMLVAGYWGFFKPHTKKEQSGGNEISIVDTAPKPDVDEKPVEIISGPYADIHQAYSKTPVDQAVINSNYLAAVKFYQENDYENSSGILKALVQYGHVDAKVLLADAYRRGAGVPQDTNMAVQLFKEAIEAGNVTAAYALGNIYEGGAPNIEIDIVAAKKYWKIAADAGYEPAIQKLKK